MYFVALATDYDGTLAEDGVVAEATLDALRRLKQSGRKLILVSGRELRRFAPRFRGSRPVRPRCAENGALLSTPPTGGEARSERNRRPLFVAELQRRKVAPLSVGRASSPRWEPNETSSSSRRFATSGLELQIIFNKGAVMVLPAGVNKASGLAAALARLGLVAAQCRRRRRRRERSCLPAGLRLRRRGRQRAGRWSRRRPIS